MNTLQADVQGALILAADTAADLMTPNPVSIRDRATVQEAVTLLTDRGLGAVPVIDEAGRPVGVLSKSDLLVHEREQQTAPAASGGAGGPPPEGGPVTRAADVMTPALFSVTPDTPSASVVEQMNALNVHHLFVVDADGVLVGVIGASDVLRRLQPGG